MVEYYRNKETGATYRLVYLAEQIFKVFKQIAKQYFDGLWEIEYDEELVGEFSTLDECFTAML